MEFSHTVKYDFLILKKYTENLPKIYLIILELLTFLLTKPKLCGSVPFTFFPEFNT